MASSVQGTLWELPGYTGNLFTADPIRTPFLSAIGSLTGGGKTTDNFEFPTTVEYAHSAAAQTAIVEDNLVSAPTFTDDTQSQVKNVCEIHYKGVRITYNKLANMGRLLGIATAGAGVAVSDEEAFQIMVKLQEIGRDVEFMMTQGTYAISTDSDVASTSRGLIECASDASNTVVAGAATLTKPMIEEIILTMFDNGAPFGDPVIIVNGFQAQQISGLYGYAPTSRIIGGLSLNQIILDLAGTVGIMVDAIQPAATLTVADLSVCSPVFQKVKDKPAGIFYEPLARDSATVKGQLYGHIGFDHGPKWAHGTITGLATS